MGRSSFEILFYCKKDTGKKSGKNSMMVRFSANGMKPVQMSLQCSVTPAIWNQKCGRAEGNSVEASELNALLNGITARFTNLYNDFLKRGELATPQQLKDAYLGKDVRRVKTLLEYFDEKLERQKQRIEARTMEKVTVDKYVRSIKYLKAFLHEKLKMNDFEFKNLTLDFIEQFQLFLTYDLGMQPNSAAKHLEHLKWTVAKAFKNGLMSFSPFDDYSIPKEDTKKEYLTESELGRIMGKEFASERMEKLRDIFVFCCFTGLAYIDAKKLNSNDLSVENDGKIWLITHRSKTGVKATVQLMDTPLSIMRKYDNEYKKSGRLLPVISNQKCNDYLKEIADLCGIKKHISFHCARYTFATTIMLNNGAELNHVQRGLGHKNIKQTQHYAELMLSTLGKTIDRCNQKTHKLQQLYLNHQAKAPAKP